MLHFNFPHQRNIIKGLDKSADTDGFITETYKSHNGTEPNVLDVTTHYQQQESMFDFSEVLKFQIVVDELRNSNFFMNFKEKLLCTLQIFNTNVETHCDDNQALDIVCYGLGNFMSCLESKYQFAFLIILKNILSPRSVIIFDPIFSKEEKCVLEDFGMDVLNVNEFGKRTISNRTIFFMPHCHYGLYNNLLSANWNKECLSKLIIIGNGLKKHSMKKMYLKQRRYIISASKFATEIKIRTNFKSVEVFHSLYLFYFHIDALCAVPFQVWNDNAEPVYCNDKRKIVNTCNECKIFRDE